MLNKTKVENWRKNTQLKLPKFPVTTRSETFLEFNVFLHENFQKVYEYEQEVPEKHGKVKIFMADIIRKIRFPKLQITFFSMMQ